MYNKNNYMRQTQRGWLRKQYLIEIKGGGCEKCGYNKCSRCLSFHHRVPSFKKFNLDLRTIGNRSWEIILAEFEKCDLLCMNCHGEHHDKEASKDYLIYQKKSQGSQINLCLNCGKDFKVAILTIKSGGGKYCSSVCSAMGRRVPNRPNKELLSKLIWEKPTTKIALDYGVTDKAIEKWCKNYGILKPPRGYWQKLNKKKREPFPCVTVLTVERTT